MVCWILILINVVYLVIGVVELLILRKYMIDKVVIYPRVSTALPFIYISIGCILMGVDLKETLTYFSLPLAILASMLLILILVAPTVLMDDRILYSFKIFHHIDKISSPLVMLLRDENMPKHCLKIIKRTILFDIGVVDKKCLNEHINNILSKYKKIDICVEKSRNIKQYEKCLRNVEKYGVELNCAEYLLDEKKYRLCIELSRHIK